MDKLDQAMFGLKVALLEKQRRDIALKENADSFEKKLEPVVDEISDWLIWCLYNPDRLKHKSISEIKSEIRKRVQRPFKKRA